MAEKKDNTINTGPAPGEAVLTKSAKGGFDNPFGGTVEEETTAKNLVEDFNVNKKPTPTSEAETEKVEPTPEAETEKVEPTPEPVEIGFVQEAIEELEVQAKARTEQLDSMQKRMDTQGSALIQEIKAKYSARKREMKRLNEARLAGMTKRGFTSGRARFATELHDQLLTEEESAGIQRLAELDRQEISAINQAKQAATNKDFQLLDMRMRQIDQLRQEKFNMVSFQHQLAIEQENQMFRRAQEKREARRFEMLEEDRAITSLASSLSLTLTGDSKKDIETVREEAIARGVNPEKLLSEVNKVSREQASADLDMATKYLNVALALDEGEVFTDPTTGTQIKGRKKKQVEVTQRIGNQEYLTTYDMSDPKNPKVVSRILTNDQVRKVSSSSGTIEKLKKNIDFLKSGGSIRELGKEETVQTFNALVDQANVSFEEFAQTSGLPLQTTPEAILQWRMFTEEAQQAINLSKKEMQKTQGEDVIETLLNLEAQRQQKNDGE